MFFITTGITIAALFLISTSMPLLSWCLPYYKIKKLKEKGLKTNIIVNIFAMLAIGWVDYHILVPYILVYGVIEGLYWYFEKNTKIKVEMFDRIFITAILVTTFMVIIGYVNNIQVGENLAKIKEIYEQQTTFTKFEIDLAFKYIKENILYLGVVYTTYTTFLVYYLIEKKSYYKWEVSYYWLIPYIILFFLERYGNIDSILITNGLEIFKIVYILYFMRAMASFFAIKIKYQGFCFALGFVTAMLFPNISFIFGVIASEVKIRIYKG